MQVVEKNDVDVERLFHWSKEVSLEGSGKKPIKAFLRLVGDADMNRARVMALRKSAELRKALKDPDSDERIAFIPYPEELPHELLVESILALSMRDFTQQVVKDIVIKPPKEPNSEATTEELEVFQKAVDEFPKKREELIRQKLDALITKSRADLDKRSDTDLYAQYLSVLVKELCDQELMRRFREYSVFFGLYADKSFTKRLFDDFDSFDNLPQEVKGDLLDQYSLLELETQELKK